MQHRHGNNAVTQEEVPVKKKIPLLKQPKFLLHVDFQNRGCRPNFLRNAEKPLHDSLMITKQHNVVSIYHS